MENGTNALRNDQQRALPHIVVERLPQCCIGFQIQRRKAIVKDKELRVLGNGSGNGQTLLLSAGDVGTAL